MDNISDTHADRAFHDAIAFMGFSELRADLNYSGIQKSALVVLISGMLSFEHLTLPNPELDKVNPPSLGINAKVPITMTALAISEVYNEDVFLSKMQLLSIEQGLTEDQARFLQEFLRIVFYSTDGLICKILDGSIWQEVVGQTSSPDHFEKWLSTWG